ncbi:uncharacterized protein EV154DRAFT_504315 [Mucor mucedo]|uniref:uncharacterized protein n=1 Tax=Mucor mucedo TaxID=29922 RepID=UPI00221F9779|nr:uncharacterized protein EV154DRAFT_504315 [Mucor mucedo]KAI7892622.1 hypothetical protein EV154DRAFT_504315 [Mucor mucedo]
MLKIFGTGKKKKSTVKPGHLKIPIPMISGVQYADMTESQISTLIGGGNRGDQPSKKSVPSISSQKTEKVSGVAAPGRSISSPPNLLMPKPVYSLPPTRFLFKSHEYEKTQVESSEDEESFSGDSSDESDIIELFPSNVIAADHTVTKEVNHKKLSPIEESEKSPIESLFTNEGVIGKLESQRQESDNNNHQSLGSVTRTSDDSIRHYTSASESPFFTTSSVSCSSNNLINDTPAFPSFSANSFLPIQPSSNNIDIAPNNNPTSSVSVHQSDTKIIKSSTQMNTYSTPQDLVESAKHTKENATFNFQNTEPNKSPSLPSEEVIQNPTSLRNNKREKTPLRFSDASSISPHPTGTSQTKVTRPSSSSASSATIGLAVTPISQSRITNNSDKPPGNQSQTSEPSAFVAFQNNNNNKNIFMPLENTSRNHSLAISDIQHNMKKMALNEDLEELKRAVDRMQQQRVSDREEHLNRVKEQKLREKEILDQINLTKQRLEMAIAGKFFMDDLNNTNDADNNAITATIGQHQASFEDLQPPIKSLNGPTIEEEYITKTNPMMKPSTSASSSRSKTRANLAEAPKSLENRQSDSGRPKGLRKQLNSSNRYSYHQESPSESYFPDASKTDFEYLNNPHGLPPQPSFASNKFRYGNVRNYHPEMEYMEGRNRYDLFDPPRVRNIRNFPQQQRRQRSKSVESQWLPPQEFIDQQQHIHRLQQQQHELSYSPAEMGDNNRFIPPGRIRSRKSSTHSAKSNPSEGTGNGQDLQNGYHSAAEKDDDDGDGEDDEMENDTNRHDPPEVNIRYNPDGDFPQQFHDDPRLSRNNSGNRYRRRPPPHSNNGPMPPSMMYHNQAFGPPPHMSHMGMMSDRDRLKMRPPPPLPYGYNNMPPPGSEYYPYIPQRVSPRMMAAFNEDQQWNPPPPHHPQWGPVNQNMYGAPPPPPENIGSGTAANSGGAVNGGVNGHHLQDTPNENNFGRRYPPTQTVPLQQTPQQSQHGYMGMYPDTSHRLYI